MVFRAFRSCNVRESYMHYSMNSLGLSSVALQLGLISIMIMVELQLIFFGKLWRENDTHHEHPWVFLSTMTQYSVFPYQTAVPQYHPLLLFAIEVLRNFHIMAVWYHCKAEVIWLITAKYLQTKLWAVSAMCIARPDRFLDWYATVTTQECDNGFYVKKSFLGVVNWKSW